MYIKITNYLVIFIIYLVSYAIADTGYNTIYLMEFDNLKNDFTNSHLKEALPDLIKENYKFREDITVEYAGDIRPYITKYRSLKQDSIKGLIINGSFQTVEDDFFIEFEAYDIHSWKQLTKRQVYCPVHDIICVHDAFLISIETSISPFLTDELDIEATIEALGKVQNERKIPSHNSHNNHSPEVENLDNLQLENDVENLQNIQSQYGTRHYREFDLSALNPKKSNKNKQNTQKLIQAFEQITTQPYDINIGELSIELDADQSETIVVDLPVTYSVRSKMALDLLTVLPHEKYLAKNENIILQFSDDEFIFDDLLMEKLALMHYQVLPVIFFNNKIGQPQLIILDSWHEKTNLFNSRKITVLWENQFKPLYSLTPSIDQVQMTLDSQTLNANYRFSIPYDKIGDYTKVTVKFMKESELKELIENPYRGG